MADFFGHRALTEVNTARAVTFVFVVGATAHILSNTISPDCFPRNISRRRQSRRCVCAAAHWRSIEAHQIPASDLHLRESAAKLAKRIEGESDVLSLTAGTLGLLHLVL